MLTNLFERLRTHSHIWQVKAQCAELREDGKRRLGARGDSGGEIREGS